MGPLGACEDRETHLLAFAGRVSHARGPRCERAGSYRRDGLLARFGVAALPDVLMALASCERRADFSRPCGTRFADLAAR